MKNNFSFLTFLLLFLTPTLFSQQQFSCGMSSTDCKEVMAEMLKNREEMRDQNFDRGAITYVPLRFFLVADLDGSGRGTERSCLTALCNLNNNYAEQEIQFYIKEFKYIDNGSIYDSPMGFSGSNAIANAMIYDAINIFVVQDAGGGAAAYFQPPYGPNGNDWVVCAKQYMTDTRVLTHELGHFFSLAHTFNGWEEEQWDIAKHGNPVTQFWAPDGSTRVELVDGSNCSNSGDGFCDTPADYLFPSGNCSYTDQVRDKNSELLEPQVDNYMNYHFGCSEYFYTDDQKAAVKNSLNSFNRNYVRPGFTPVTTEITDKPTLISPENDEQLDYHENVYLTWEPVEGAQYYIVDLLSGTTKIKRIVDTNFILFEDELQPDKSYLWKVMPFNESYGCAQFSSTIKFRTGEGFNSIQEITEVSEFSILPNPVQAGSNINISISADENFDATIFLVSMTGQIVNSIQNYQFQKGNASLELSTSKIPSGVYFVNIQSEKGVLNKKIIVSK